MPTATVRISSDTRQTLRQISATTGESMQAILDRAVEDYRRRVFLEQANRAFARLREDPEAWAAEQEERAAWDATLADGLDEE
jgi:hypothetical protein